ncbi:MAG: hypothetical protein EOO27_09475 [Comamonadaceae bacterium]|nr:MAG: hypothetical protein EOO27_09475 [Comamonadaceae bacterium]
MSAGASTACRAAIQPASAGDTQSDSGPSRSAAGVIVVTGLTLPHSSGGVEGRVNTNKMLIRLTYGRANFDYSANASFTPYRQAPIGITKTDAGPQDPMPLDRPQPGVIPRSIPRRTDERFAAGLAAGCGRRSYRQLSSGRRPSRAPGP